MVPLPFPASFLPSMGNRTCRYSQGGLLRYDCRGLVSIGFTHIPSCALHGGVSPVPFIETSYPHVYEERILHG